MVVCYYVPSDWPLAAAAASWEDATSAKGQSGTGRVQEWSDLRKGASSLNKAVANSERA